MSVNDSYSRLQSEADIIDSGRPIEYHPHEFKPSEKFRNNNKMNKDESLEFAREMIDRARLVKPLEAPE